MIHGGKIVFYGDATFSQGSSIRVENSWLEVGDNFYCNKNCFFSCSEGITIGKDVLLGWNVNIRDSDGHTMIYDNQEQKNTNSVHIGNHVWLASYADILKGVSIGSDSVVAYNSCVTKPFEESNVLIGGYPAKIIKHNVNWKK